MDNIYYQEVYGIDEGDALINIFLPKGRLGVFNIVFNKSLPYEFMITGADDSSFCGIYNTVSIKKSKDSTMIGNLDFLISYYECNKVKHLPSSIVDCDEDIEVCFEFKSESESKLLFARYEKTITRDGASLSFGNIISSREINKRLQINDSDAVNYDSKNKFYYNDLCNLCEGHKIADYI